MSTTLSIARAGAVASTALLIGAYVWFQAKNGNPEVVADTTTGQAVTKPVGLQPPVLPGPKSSGADVTVLTDLLHQNSSLLPGSKDALVFPPNQPALFPGSKYGTIDPAVLPGSKRGTVFKIGPDIQSPPGNEKITKAPATPAKRPLVLPGSKVKAPLIPPTSDRPAPQKAKPTVFPGSKSRSPVIPVTPPRKKPAVFPGSKSAPVRIVPQQQKSTPPPAAVPPSPPATDQQKKPTVLPGSKAPSSLLQIDPAILKKALEDQSNTGNDPQSAPRKNNPAANRK